MGILKSDHGPHSAEALAAATAAEIIEIGAGAAGETAIAGRKLELKILDILEDHHEVVSHAENEQLEAGHDRLNAAHDVEEFVAHAVADIVEEAAKTQWAAHFKDPEVLAQIAHVIGKWFATNQHVHRGWHAAKHKDQEHPALAEFKAHWNV